MTTANLAAAVLRDVPHDYNENGQRVLLETDVLAALTSALDPAMVERAGEVLPRLRKADEYEPLGHDGWEAADLITALLAQNAALRSERDTVLGMYMRSSDEGFRQKARAEAAETALAAIPARGVHGVDAVLDAAHDYLMQQYGHSPLKHPVDRARILAALGPARAPDLSDPVVVHLNMLRGTIAKPTVEQIVHLYGREAFQPMIDAAVAKALGKACLAVSEHADWPEDEHGRTEQVGLFAGVINAILAITPAALAPTDAAHVNETPKSEHDGADVLTAAQAREAAMLDGGADGRS